MRRLLAATAIVSLTALGAGLAYEAYGGAEAPQRRRGFSRWGSIASSKDLPIRNIPFDGKFTFLRLRFDEAMTSPSRQYEFGIDQGWNHDYPRAELSLI